jgi:hypothetical protein
MPRTDRGISAKRPLTVVISPWAYVSYVKEAVTRLRSFLAENLERLRKDAKTLTLLERGSILADGGGPLNGLSTIPRRKEQPARRHNDRS